MSRASRRGVAGKRRRARRARDRDRIVRLSAPRPFSGPLSTAIARMNAAILRAAKALGAMIRRFRERIAAGAERARLARADRERRAADNAAAYRAVYRALGRGKG